MRRLGRHTQGVLRAALACGMGVQILLGLAWLMQNMGGLQNFQESRLLLAGESTGNGFYSGILYRGLALLLSSRLWILYVVQLSAAFAAAWVLWACFSQWEQKTAAVMHIGAGHISPGHAVSSGCIALVPGNLSAGG